MVSTNVPRKEFCILGFPISSSKSPILHNTAFAYHHLPHHYRIAESTTLDEATTAIIRSPDFGGCSVTMPHKMTIMEYVDTIAPAAKLLGAVNTVSPKLDPKTGETVLIGDNTDYVGIMNCLQTSLTKDHGFEAGISTGLVIGAGGAGRAAVYALALLKCSTIYIYNRTRATAEAVAASFPPSYNIVVLDSLTASSFTSELPTLIVGTVPAWGTSTHTSPPLKGAESTLYLDSDCLAREKGGVLVDMAYLPRETPLVKLATAMGDKWAIQTGILVLLQQGYAQFEMWNGLRAPRKEVADAVLAAYDAENPIAIV